MRSKLLLAICLLMLPACMQAQTGHFFNPDKQLSSSFVTQVYFDKDGYLWATTRNGINRYDGYQFHVFKKENERHKTLESNYVNTMLQDRNGLFYFGMYGSLQTWDGNTFENVKMIDAKGQENRCYINCFLERKNGDVLVGTSGMGVLKFKDKHHAIQMNGPLADMHTILAMLEDHQGRLWLISEKHGLLCYDGKTLKHYLADRPDLVMTELAEDQNGRIYVGTSNEGVLQKQGENFVSIAGTGGRSVSALFCDHLNNILIGYDGKGIAFFNPKTGQVADNPYFSLEVDLSISKVYSIAEDRQGNLWFGLLQKGIYCQPIQSRGFSYMGPRLGSRNVIGDACVVSVLLDSKGGSWIGTDKDGLYHLDHQARLVRHFADGIPSTIMSLAEGIDGRIWLGSYREGMGWIDPATLRYHQVVYPKDEHLRVMDIAVDPQGRLWLATLQYGVVCMTANGEVLKTYTAAPNAENDRNVNSIVNDFVSQVSFSPDGKLLYASTSMGLCCLDIASGSWTKAFGTNCPNYGVPIRVTREFDGKLWLGSTSGLYCYDLGGQMLKHYQVADGLVDNGIASIEQDAWGRLWIGTDHGLSCMNLQSGRFQNYFVDDGLQGNEFSDGASNVSVHGTIILGGTGGVTWFKPQDISQRRWNATVNLTSFAVNGQPVNKMTKSDGYQVTDTTIIASSRFELSYNDNSFAVQFSTLTYENPEHISYLYSINGEDFVRLQPGVNVLTFSHLPHGTYRFRVKAERNNRETPIREFTVVVHSPWYRSAWAYFFYAVIIGLFLWQYYAYRRHREQTRQRLQEHLHAEELGEAKVRFFVNMSHEIRTPMTLIITPLLSLIKNEDDPHRKSVYETIRRNAERILSLINQMMDLRKIDKGQMQMRMSETNLISFIQDIYQLFEGQAKTKGINFVYDHDAKCMPVWIDRSNFDKVIMNILSNAFKFTPTGGEIGIRVTHDAQHATIAIRDNGEKIPEDKLDKIFQRFYQSSSVVNDRHAGTGVGLDLTRSLVELHHGTISAHNLEQGCEFVVTIPLGNAHLKPEEMIFEAEAQEELQEVPVVAEPEVEEIPAELMAESTSPNRKLTLVIAEDDDEIRSYLESELDKDYEVHACTNGREALAEVYKIMPDLVLSDVMMPEMDGTTLCQKLKTNPSTNVIPVILLTAKNRDEDKLEGLETGADAYFVKPFNMEILKRTILNLIGSHRLLRLKYERNDDLEEQVDEIRIKTPDEKLLDRIMDCINKNLNNSDLSVDMIAEEVGISRVHLHRKMKELTGQTPHDFIRNIRLKKAARLLANQGMNVTEVMYACGFANSASFSTVFKRFYGMSPRDYMKEHEERQG